MAHVVAAPCYDCKYTDCCVVCPVECFYQDRTMLYIDPEDCIDCEACVPECPVEAIYSELNLPIQWTSYVQLNAERVAYLKPLPTENVPQAVDYRTQSIDPAWQTDTVSALARQVLDGDRFEILPILADALEEAGCTDRTLLDYCRNGAGGRWPAEWILGRFPEGRIVEHQYSREGPECGKR